MRRDGSSRHGGEGGVEVCEVVVNKTGKLALSEGERKMGQAERQTVPKQWRLIMETKTEKLKIPVSNIDTSLQLLIQVTSLLIYSKEWVVEKKNLEDIISARQANSINFIDINVQELSTLDDTTEVIINSENASADEFRYATHTIKSCLAFLLNKQNEETINKILEQTSSIVEGVFLAPIKKQTDWISSEIDRISKEPALFALQAMRIISEAIPDIQDNESTYWDKIQPLPEYLLDEIVIEDAEEKLNLALGLELEPLDTAMSNFMLMSLWLTKGITKGEVSWTGDDIQNIPDIKPLARQIISSTKKHLIRDARSLDALFALRLQRAAYYFLNEREKMGEAEHAIAKLRSLINAGFIQAEKGASQKENSIKQKNNGKALEEEVKELLQSMGLKAATTRTTGDGGIDIIAYSDSPVFSGKYVVQCKDWTGSVGEGVIRDLYGVVTAESANKGILITTGTITKSAQKFSEGKPLELIDGQELNRLMQKFKKA